MIITCRMLGLGRGMRGWEGEKERGKDWHGD